jgi:hypothetical protein
VNSDRFGYFDQGYYFWPYLIRAGQEFGLDPDDPVYRVRNRSGDPCRVCGVHRGDDRYFPCDVFHARARAIETAGYPATFCGRCSDAMPVREGQVVARCWFCEDPPPRYRPKVTNGGAYVDDGVGDVEKLPAWSVDWSGQR